MHPKNVSWMQKETMDEEWNWPTAERTRNSQHGKVSRELAATVRWKGSRSRVREAADKSHADR